MEATESLPPLSAAIRDQVEATSFVDTHEHLPDESIRLAFRPIGGGRDWDHLIDGRALVRSIMHANAIEAFGGAPA